MSYGFHLKFKEALRVRQTSVNRSICTSQNTCAEPDNNAAEIFKRSIAHQRPEGGLEGAMGLQRHMAYAGKCYMCALLCHTAMRSPLGRKNFAETVKIK